MEALETGGYQKSEEMEKRRKNEVVLKEWRKN